jgi:hypothetical protein
MLGIWVNFAANIMYDREGKEELCYDITVIHCIFLSEMKKAGSENSEPAFFISINLFKSLDTDQAAFAVFRLLVFGNVNV